jgi:group I intron endonuclease
MGTIYLIKNKNNGKMYVGQTKRKLKYRITEHLNQSQKEQPRLLIHRAIKKYGKDNFDYDVIEICDDSCLDEREQHHINTLQTISPYGYNLAQGGLVNFGCSGDNHYLNQMSTDEKEIWLIRYRCGENNPNFGNGDSIKGNNHYLNQMSTDEKEIWLDENLRGSNNYQKNLTTQELKDKCWINNSSEEKIIEWKAKCSAWQKGKPKEKTSGSKHGKAKKIVVIYPDGKEMIILCVSEFAKEHELYYQNLIGIVNGRYKTHKGFKARNFTDEDINLDVWEN